MSDSEESARLVDVVNALFAKKSEAVIGVAIAALAAGFVQWNGDRKEQAARQAKLIEMMEVFLAGDDAEPKP